MISYIVLLYFGCWKVYILKRRERGRLSSENERLKYKGPMSCFQATVVLFKAEVLCSTCYPARNHNCFCQSFIWKLQPPLLPEHILIHPKMIFWTGNKKEGSKTNTLGENNYQREIYVYFTVTLDSGFSVAGLIDYWLCSEQYFILIISTWWFFLENMKKAITLMHRGAANGNSG